MITPGHESARVSEPPGDPFHNPFQRPPIPVDHCLCPLAQRLGLRGIGEQLRQGICQFLFTLNKTDSVMGPELFVDGFEVEHVLT